MGSDVKPSEYLEALSAYRVNPARTDHGKLTALQPFLVLLDNVEKSSIALFDMATMGYAFLTANFRYLLGSGETAQGSPDMPYLFSRMHTDDRELFLDTSIQAFSYLNALDASCRREYRTCQDFRILREDGKWIRLIQQMLVIELDEDGNIWLVLIVNDLSPVRDQSIPGRRFMEHIPSKRRVLFPASEAAAPSPLTKRELEILGLVSHGYPSSDIADFLGISAVTVNNHRQNILSKLGAANSAEAVSYAASLGLMG